MQFDSLTFIVFFGLLQVAFWAIQEWSQRKNLLLAASYLFYAAWNPLYIGLIALSTVVDWLVAGRMVKSQSVSRRRLLLATSLVINFGLLAYFKYTNFLLNTWGDLLAIAGLSYVAPAYDIVLPVGISFYTFQTLSYTIDVYRGKIDRHWEFRDFALFVSFFPQLVAGPIVRAAHFLPQTDRPVSFQMERFNIGLALIICGLFMKVVLADSYVAPVADTVFARAGEMSAAAAWLGTFAFGAQIFFDFAGYSTIAIGAAACFGFSIPENFRKPYAAQTFSDFWKRWHISLSSWFRDYLYIPLGGNRGSRLSMYRNLLLTMLVAGLWHGASWMFLIWGLIHGVLLALERYLHQGDVDVPRVRKWIYSLFVFIAVQLAWVFFRAPNMETANDMLMAMLGRNGNMPDSGQEMFALITIICMVSYHAWFRSVSLQETVASLKPVLRGSLLGILLLMVFLYSGGDDRSFIYFQF